MKKVILVSGHFYESKRKAGFHLIADAFVDSGYSVIFVTAPCSHLFKLKKHYSKDLNFAKNKLVKHSINMQSYVHFTLFHIANLRSSIANYLTRYLFKIYQSFSFKNLENSVKEADFVIFESTPGLFLFTKFKNLNKKAKFIYRVSDDFEILNAHSSLIKYEEDVLKDFDLVSVPSQYIYDKLRKKDSATNIKLQYHGINKELYEEKYDSPYQKGSTNAVFIGITKLDYNFLQYAANAHENITFHIIGPLEKRVKRNNIIYYGEIPFVETIPYVKHADIGLHTLEYSNGAESFTDSLKVHQYTYCELPIIAPEFLRTKRDNTFYYKDKNDISNAVSECLKYKKNNKVFKNNTITWIELQQKLIEDEN